MPVASSQPSMLSPAELSYLHASLTATPPLRPDLRTPAQFRPLIAETDILPSTNGSARICFSDGAEALVGVKADVERTVSRQIVQQQAESTAGLLKDDVEMGDGADGEGDRKTLRAQDDWVEVSLDIPGFRDDDALPVFLASMLLEALLAAPELKQRLVINERWHWRLYIDILLLSQPHSYPLPLLSLTTHLALLSTHLPHLISDPQDDPLFNDDWAAATPLYPSAPSASANLSSRPPITLLVMTTSDTILFDPSREELAVADAVLAISLGYNSTVLPSSLPSSTAPDSKPQLNVLAVRMVDPPGRMTGAGTTDKANPNVSGSAGAGTGVAGPTAAGGGRGSEVEQGDGGAGGDGDAEWDEQSRGRVWRPPVGGVRRGVLTRVIKMAVEPGGVGDEVMEGLAGFVG